MRFPAPLLAPRTAWVGALLALATLAAVIRFVDLSPRVESDFFFADQDPQIQASRTLDERFPSQPQILIRAEATAEGTGPESGEPAARDPEYRRSIEELSDALLAVEGVTTVYSIATHDAGTPLFGRLLRTPDPRATNVVLATDGTDPEVLLPRLERVVDAARRPGLELQMSGAPVIVELIRRALFDDLMTFGVAAVGLFGALLVVVYRDARVVAGVLTACLTAVAVTLLLARALGIGIGLLTANLVTIVFVLALSHAVFLTGNWKRARRRPDDPEEEGRDRPEEPARSARRAVRQGLGDTLEPSFWSMATTLLGFLSLLLASARPLRELGTAGAVGTVTAMGAVYLILPSFLVGCGSRQARREEGQAGGDSVPEGPTGTILLPVLTGVAVLLLGTGILRLDTDPGLLSYFDSGSRLARGLEQIDTDGGSSPLDVAVRDPEGRRLTDQDVYARLGVLQDSLESDPEVGVVLSPYVLLEQARTFPLARFLPLDVLLELAQSPRLDAVGLAFVTPDADQGLFFLRMREGRKATDRQATLERIRSSVGEAGLEVVLMGGLYDLQARLGELLRWSLVAGIGGLLVLFTGIALVVARSVPLALGMVVCLTSIPAVVLGLFGHLGIAVDIITAPAANIALAMGVDSMIHLVVRVRKLGPGGRAEAVRQMRGPILTATGLTGTGFGIFVLSSFPPTRRFGLAVALGTATAAWVTLVVLPRLSAWREARAAEG